MLETSKLTDWGSPSLPRPLQGSQLCFVGFSTGRPSAWFPLCFPLRRCAHAEGQLVTGVALHAASDENASLQVQHGHAGVQVPGERPPWKRRSLGLDRSGQGRTHPPHQTRLFCQRQFPPELGGVILTRTVPTLPPN